MSNLDGKLGKFWSFQVVAMCAMTLASVVTWIAIDFNAGWIVLLSSALILFGVPALVVAVVLIGGLFFEHQIKPAIKCVKDAFADLFGGNPE